MDAKAIALASNRFGFTLRTLPAVCTKGEVANTPNFDIAQFDVTHHIDECLGDLDSVNSLLKTKTVKRQLDFVQAKAKVVELTDLVTQLKAALAELVKRARSLTPTLVEAQKEVNCWLRSQGEALGVADRELERMRAELSGWQQRADERARKLNELRDQNSSLEEREMVARTQADEELKRASHIEGLVIKRHPMAAQSLHSRDRMTYSRFFGSWLSERLSSWPPTSVRRLSRLPWPR